LFHSFNIQAFEGTVKCFVGFRDKLFFAGHDINP
jgi:hypothetical protein